MESLKTYYPPFLNALDELGFCTLRLFDENQINRLRQLYNSYFGSSVGQGLHATHNSNPVEQALAVSDEINAIVGGTLQDLFPDYDFFIGHFMVKGAKSPDEFRLHQDWNIVDETKYKTYQVWIPLELTYPSNGGLFVVPGSHRFFGNFRSGSYDIPRIAYDDNIRHVSTDIIVPPGNAVIYHNALFHGSYANKTNKERIAVIVNYKQKNAPTYYFHYNETAHVTDLYAIDTKALVQDLPRLEKNQSPELPLAGHLPACEVKNASIRSVDLLEKYQSYFGTVPAMQVKQLHLTNERALEEELNKEGFAVIDLLNESEQNTFKQFYDAHFGQLDRTPGRFTTLQHTDIETRNKMHAFIVQEIQEPLRRFFKDFVIPVSQFYTKKAHTSGDIDLHADSTLLVNHQLEPHYAIWVPLLDIDASMGTLTVIPRSHLPKNVFFSGSLGGYHHGHMDWLRTLEVPLRLKAGQAVVFDNNLLHNSTANSTDVDRVCFTFRMTHHASLYYSFVAKDNDSIELWEEEFNHYMVADWDGDSKKSIGQNKGQMHFSKRLPPKNELVQILIQDLEK